MSKNLIIIKDTIEDFIHIFSKNADDGINLYLFSLEKFISLTTELTLDKSGTLVIMPLALRNRINSKRVKELFNKRFGFKNPHIIYIFKDSLITGMIKKIRYEEGNSYYIYNETHLTDPNFFVNFNSFVESAFLRILSNYRVDEYIVKAFQMIVDAEIIKTQKDQIELMSKVDYLTNTLNRGALFQTIDKERERTLRNLRRLKNINRRYPSFTNAEDMIEDFIIYSCIMLDIDYFKKINDTYGHLTGDEVLKRIGELITSRYIFRETDVAGRYGGEEFIILLPETNAKNAFVSAERLRKILKQENFTGPGGKVFRVTISIGISEFYPEDEKTEDILERADMALYHAKNSGRDRTIIFEEKHGASQL